jgi:hypothetical protein
MNLKKEVIVAAFLAIILGTGLGYATYSFIAETPPEKSAVKALDLHAQQGGLGTGGFGGIFQQNKMVQLSAYLTVDGAPLNQTEVTFKIIKPNEQEIVNTALTDDSGNAKLEFTLPTEESALGNWSVLATALVKNEIVSDSMILECQPEQISSPLQWAIDLYTQRGGLGIGESGGIFEQEELVQLLAYLTSGGSPVNLTEVVFTVTDPNANETIRSGITEVSGKAKMNFTLPSDGSTVGNWTVTVVANVDNETVSDSMVFGCKVKEVPPPVLRTLDLYTQQGGFGPGELFGGVFLPGDVVQLFAYLTGDGVPINGSEVAFTIQQYAGIPVTDSALTDNRGIAELNFTIPSDPSSAGNWTVSAVAYFESGAVNDSVFIGCTTGEEPRSILVLIKRNGELCVGFNPLDYVTVAVHMYCKYDLLPLPVKLEVLLPNGTCFLNRSLTTDMWGDAVTEFQIPLMYEALGTWSTHVSFEVHGSRGDAYNFFDCATPELALDVYTPRGGQGPNVPSGPFSLGENVSLSAVFRVMNASAAAGKLVSFEVRFNGTTLLVRVAETDSTGVASVSFGIPSDPMFVGPWEVYARLHDGGIVLLDTLVFAVNQPQG